MIPHPGARSPRRGHTLSEIAERDGPGDEEEDHALLHLPKKPIHTPGTPRRVARRDSVGGARGHRRGMGGVNSKTQAAVYRSTSRS